MKKIKNAYLEYFNKKKRKRLKNKNFTIISSNCTGGQIYHDLRLEFLTPTINLYIKPRDFIIMLENFDDYLLNDKYELIEEKSNHDFPVAKLGEIHIYFMHYNSFEEAKNKWYERKQRINKKNMFIIMSERDGCTYEDLKKFDKLYLENKVVLTNKKYNDIKSSFYIKGFENKKELGFVFERCLLKRYIDQFDYVNFFNNGNKV